MRLARICSCCLMLIVLMGEMASAQKNCGVLNTALRSGEVLKYKVFYTLAGVYVGAGEAEFKIQVSKKTRGAFYLTGFGKTYSGYNWIYPVNDLYESVADSLTFEPYWFRRQIREGGRKKLEEFRMDRSRNEVLESNRRKKVSDCVTDVLSVIYYARCIPYHRYLTGAKIPIQLYLDGEEYPVYIRYLGKEKITTPYGTYQTIKFKPLLLEGTLFTGGEQMTVWVTDDEQHMPVYVDTPILVGHIRVYLGLPE